VEALKLLDSEKKKKTEALEPVVSNSKDTAIRLQQNMGWLLVAQ